MDKKIEWQIQTKGVLSSPDEVKNAVLAARGITDSSSFFNPPHPASFELSELGIDQSNVHKALEIINAVKKADGTVVIFGDYDADGICATSLLWQTLHEAGVKVWPFIPRRDTHGYGLTTEALQEIATERNPDLVITVDNGIVAHEAIAAMKNSMPKTKLIITDHHQPELAADGSVHMPAADAVVHSTKLCGASVAWILAREFAGAEAVAKHLDLAGLATIADQVPLQGANRSFAYHGITSLQSSKRVGIAALCTVGSVAQPSLDEHAVGFNLAPRINAMGRLSHGLEALRLLCTQNQAAASRLAQVLSDTNKERQGLTQDLTDHAVTQALAQSKEHIIIVSSPEYHEGVIGLIAGRLTQQFHKPSIVFSTQGDKVAKASARSIPGVNIVDFLRLMQSDFVSVGGHPMAAGLSVLPESLADVTARLQKLAKKNIDAKLLIPQIIALGELDHLALTTQTVDVLEQFRPWGAGHREPFFVIKKLQLSDVSSIGSSGQHLKLWCRTSDGNYLTVLGWGKSKLAESLDVGSEIDVIGVFSAQTYKGNRKLQVILQDVRVV